MDEEEGRISPASIPGSLLDPERCPLVDLILPLLLWKRMARIVRMLCAVCIALRKYAMEAGLLEHYTVAISTRRRRNEEGQEEEEELSFNLEDFKLSKELKVPKAIKDLLEKSAAQRSADDLYAISSMMREMPSFKKYTREMRTMMCRIVRYMKCGRRRVVLRKGHIGYSVYFIFSGSVNVVLDKDEQNVFVKERVVTLKKGACFGEVALMQNSRRNATIVCADETEFLVIDKEDFLENGLDKQMQEEFITRFKFFRSWYPVHHWTDDEIKNLSSICRTEEFHHNRLIAKDTTKNDWLCFVIKGSCDVLHLVNLHESPEYQTILSLRPSSASPTKKFQRSSSPLSRKVTTFPRAQSAPHKPKSRRQCPTQRPESCLGLADETLKVDKLSSPRYSEPHKSGIYVKVETLRDGSCFGLEGLDESTQKNISSQQLSIISRGCTLIHIPRSRFKELADDQTLSQIRPLVKKYPTDDELCKDFVTKVKWDHFKQDLVGRVLKQADELKITQEGLRDCLKKSNRPIRENTFMCDRIDSAAPTKTVQLPRPGGLGTLTRKTSFGKITTHTSDSKPQMKIAMWKVSDNLQSSTALGDRFRMTPDKPRVLFRASVTRTASSRKGTPTNGNTLLVNDKG